MNGEEILFIGPRSRGGMNEVLEAYGRMLPGARFVATYHGGSALSKIADFIKGYAHAAWLLMTRPSIRLVHIHTASGASFRRKMYFARLARLLGRKVVMHVHSGRFRDFFATDPERIGNGLRSCDAVICLTDGWLDFFNSQGVDNAVVIPNPIEYPAEVKRDDAGGKIHFLFLGVLARPKGVIDLVEAVASLPVEVREKIVVHIAGSGAEEATLREMIATAGLDSCVTLEGWVSGTGKERLMQLSHCFVLPSYFEGLPVSILEAMAREMPVIASNVGGIPSIVADGANGFLIAPGDTKALADSISALATDPALRLSMGQVSRQKAAAYASPKVLAALTRLYSSLGVNL